MSDNNSDLIQREIIDQNFDLDRFYLFIQRQNLLTNNLEDMEFEQLRDLVEEFKKGVLSELEFGKENLNFVLSDDMSEELSADSGLENENDLRNRISSIFTQNENETEEFFELESNNQLEFNEFFKTDGIKARIIDFKEEKKKKFMITIKFKIYSILTEPFGWVVKREMKDFINLQKSLKKTFPFIVVN